MESQLPPPPPYQQHLPQSQSQGYGAPQASYIPPPVGQPAIEFLEALPAFRDFPVRTICPECHAIIVTSISYETGTATWLWCFIGSCCGCCCFPFILNICKDVVHTCPLCHTYIYRFNRLS